MNSGTKQIKNVLRALGEKITFHRCEPIGLVVCGGAALSVADIISRPTQDVDIVALAEVAIFDGGTVKLLQAPDVLPESLRICAAEVARDFDLDSSWLNVGPRRLFDNPLPNGIEGRLTVEEFGTHLRVCWLGRQDLISLKLYAASDDRGPRQDQHIADLMQLRPSFDEADAAVDWIREHPDFEEKKLVLKDVLSSMELDDLAYYV